MRAAPRLASAAAGNNNDDATVLPYTVAAFTRIKQQMNCKKDALSTFVSASATSPMQAAVQIKPKPGTFDGFLKDCVSFPSCLNSTNYPNF
jgi:hypothetical protein